MLRAGQVDPREWRESLQAAKFNSSAGIDSADSAARLREKLEAVPSEQSFVGDLKPRSAPGLHRPTRHADDVHRRY